MKYIDQQTIEKFMEETIGDGSAWIGNASKLTIDIHNKYPDVNFINYNEVIYLGVKLKDIYRSGSHKITLTKYRKTRWRITLKKAYLDHLKKSSTCSA